MKARRERRDIISSWAPNYLPLWHTPWALFTETSSPTPHPSRALYLGAVAQEGIGSLWYKTETPFFSLPRWNTFILSARISYLILSARITWHHP